MHTAPADTPGPGWSSHSWRIDPGGWRGLSPQLRRLRRLLLLIGAIPVIVLVSLIGGAFLGLPGLAVGAVPTAATVWGWRSIGRAWSAWRYAEREDDLLISHGTFVRRLVVVPYGRMQLVDVTAGPLAQRFGIAQVRLHTAAATTDAVIPGLSPVEAARLRDSLTERGEAQAAVL
ncbi:PH domain-containing protein [Frankia sp. Mgl5]|uniref:PH domain-containing protein n=1 Tax=Frankiaceae TaxID=74712 RepID=UPI0000541FDD|nr:PH domain-containing protein [Frankia sp. Mgl5]ABW09691.1 membrane-flanked domain [Frankia sp. EAN1pec]MCK9929289.1 PH domain-containing protein [Frankia sp. Mgl5]